MTRCGTLLVLVLAALVPQVRGEDTVDYTKSVKPLLKERCYACHGALKQESGLRLDSGALILKGGSGGPAAVAGNVADSLLIERVTAGEGERMPPEGSPLTAEQIDVLKRWIAQGAKVPETDAPEKDPRDHWAFRPPVRPALPDVAHADWNKTPIDKFLAAAQQKQGIVPLGPADKTTLLKRVTLDLIGLPPSREELHAFLADESPEAYEKVVNRLLESPHYGERWARHWMDVWRYSDWYGRRSVPDVMNSYPQIYRWRDWIVRSLNEDRGYDWMVARMLAADEIDPASDADLVATGFVVRNWFKWNYNQWMRDQVEHTGKAFLGLTFNCCHCHDHKYDPISQEDYFRFRAFFEPLELRHDRVPGEADPGPFQKYVYAKSYGPIKSGMIRVFDEKLEAPTLMYEKGDERKKMEGRPPVTAGMPAAIGGDTLKVQPVTLPAVAAYPGLKSFVQQETLAVAKAELTTAQTAVDTLRAKAPAAGEAAKDLGLLMAEANLAAAQAHAAWTEARIAADVARYSTDPAVVAGSPALIAAAAKAEQQLAVARARASVSTAEKAVADAEAMQGDAAKPAKDKAAQQLVAARTALATAETAAMKEAADYTPLSPKYPTVSTGRRKALAEWITRRDNPLTARVAVNHLWGWHFGRPLVESTFNFGRGGKLPSHPELLDWLAVELMDNGWRMKPLHRQIVLSAAYRTTSTVKGPVPASDPDNRLLWRFNSRRVEAELVRDGLLAVAGVLDRTIGGVELDQSQGLTSHRRSLYFAHHGEEKMQFLELFDAANPTDCYERTSSVTPQQSLALANSDLTQALSKTLTQKLTQETADPAAFITAAFEQILSRPPTAAEIDLSQKFLQKQVSIVDANKAREGLVQALMNHNDFVTVR